MFSSLTPEQRQRKEALREAKALLRANTTDPEDHKKILEVADYILGLHRDIPPKGSSNRKLFE